MRIFKTPQIKSKLLDEVKELGEKTLTDFSDLTPSLLKKINDGSLDLNDALQPEKEDVVFNEENILALINQSGTKVISHGGYQTPQNSIQYTWHHGGTTNLVTFTSKNYLLWYEMPISLTHNPYDCTISKYQSHYSSPANYTNIRKIASSIHYVTAGLLVGAGSTSTPGVARIALPDKIIDMCSESEIFDLQWTSDVLLNPDDNMAPRNCQVYIIDDSGNALGFPETPLSSTYYDSFLVHNWTPIPLSVSIQLTVLAKDEWITE